MALFLFDGQHQRLCTIASTPQPVMCGAMAVCCMRYGVSDTSRLRVAPIHKYTVIYSRIYCRTLNTRLHCCPGSEGDQHRIPPTTSSRLSSEDLRDHDQVLVSGHLHTHTHTTNEPTRVILVRVYLTHNILHIASKHP